MWVSVAAVRGSAVTPPLPPRMHSASACLNQWEVLVIKKKKKRLFSFRQR